MATHDMILIGAGFPRWVMLTSKDDPDPDHSFGRPFDTAMALVSKPFINSTVASQQASIQGLSLHDYRTGTLSVKSALEMLFPGKKCYHMVESIKNKEHPRWAALVKHGWKAERNNILKVLSRYHCTQDFPCMLYWKDIKQEFPQAIILLTVRDSFDVWYKSVYDTIYHAYLNVHRIPWWSKPFLPQLAAQRRTVDAFFGRGGLFDGRFEDKEFARKVYEDFIADVKRNVPQDQLLVFNVKEGWEPLCKFLGVPCPDQPFPRINETAGFTELMKARKAWKQRRLNTIKTVFLTVVTAAVATGIAVVQRRK